MNTRPGVKSLGQGTLKVAPASVGAGESKISPASFITTIAAPSTNGGSLNVIEIDSWDTFTSESAAGEVLTSSVCAEAVEIGLSTDTPTSARTPNRRFEV